MPPGPAHSWAANGAFGGSGGSGGSEQTGAAAPARLLAAMQRVHVAASIKVRRRDQLRMQVRDTESAVLENPGGARRAMARTRTEQTREQVQTKHRARAMSLLRAGYDRSEANDPLDRAAATIQRAVRTQLFAGHRSTCAVRLHCKRLAERLLYEAQILRGTFRFFNQIVILALMLAALGLSTNPAVRLGVRENFRASFALDDLVRVTRRDEFESRLKKLASVSKDFFPLSSRHFYNHDMGDMELIGRPRTFEGPILLSRTDVACLATFSFTVWVNAVPQFTSGYIVRKGIGIPGSGSDLACWGLYLHSQRGPELHYGAHDDLSGKRLEVGLDAPEPFAVNRYTLVTVVINITTVTFYQDLRKMGERQLSRPVTDCSNDNKGIFVGDANLELGQLRSYVRALSFTNVQEIFELGSRLSDISTGSEPTSLEKDKLDLLEGEVKESVFTSTRGFDGVRDSAELFGVIQQATADSRANQVVYSSPAAARGNIRCESYNPSTDTHAAVLDAVTARKYYPLMSAPSRLSTTTDADARYLEHVPSFLGTGATLTWWYRHVKCVGTNCGVYLMHAFDQSGIQEHSFCWSIWLENDALWFDNLKGTPKYQYPKFSDEGLASKYKFRGDKIWRHMAFVWDELSDEIRFYLDGTLVLQKPWGSAVANADCNGVGKRVAIGHSHPGYTYGAEVEIADLRMYVHNLEQPAAPLSDEDIFKIATANTPALSSEHKCKAVTEVLDTLWKDQFGNGCEWYYQKRVTHAEVCASEEARTNCPQACASVQECFVVEDFTPVFRVWDRVRRLEPMASNGSLCLGSSVPREEVLRQCELWQKRGGVDAETPAAIESWLESMEVGREGRRINLTEPCSRIALAIDDHCSFNSTEVREFSGHSRANNGDMTISFWAKPVGQPSMIGERFFPQVSWFAQLHPPQHQLTQGLWFNPNGEFRVSSDCRPPTSRWSFENIEMHRASEREWTFFAIVIRNMTETVQTKVSVFTNLGRNWELSDFPICHYDGAALFNMIEVNYAMLLSPLTLLPKALPDAKVQSLFYESVNDMSWRVGPRIQERERAEQAVPLTKQDYVPKSALVASPVVFQERAMFSKSGCDITYSSQWEQEQQRKTVEERCAAPFVCEHLSENARAGDGHTGSVISCPGKADWEMRHFGLKSTVFLGKNGFADFLYSISDNEFLNRPDNVSDPKNVSDDRRSKMSATLVRTSDFIDSFSRSVRVILLFFTPQYGLTSICTINAFFHEPASAAVSYDLLHYEIIEGSKLMLYLVVQVLVVINLVGTMFDAFYQFRILYIERRLGILINSRDILGSSIDLIVASAIFVYVGIRMADKSGSAATSAAILSDLDQIDWSTSAIELHAKKTFFLEKVSQVHALAERERMIDNLCHVILMVNLIRVINATSMHPRLNLLLGTLQVAFNDLMHAIILILLLMGFFAGIGHWRFGSTRADFSSVSRAIATEFYMMFGEFPDDWNETMDLQMFIMIYFVVIFLLVLNFVLAIIVEAYVDLRNQNRVKHTSKDFFSDLVFVVYTKRIAYLNFWPNCSALGSLLWLWDARLSVGYHDLIRIGAFGSRGNAFIGGPCVRALCFPFYRKCNSEHDAVCSFLRHYSQYDFLRPPTVGKYSVQDQVLDDSKSVPPQRRGALLIPSAPGSFRSGTDAALHNGKHQQSFKDMMASAVETVQHRRSRKRHSLPPVSRSLSDPTADNSGPAARQAITMDDSSLHRPSPTLLDVDIVQPLGIHDSGWGCGSGRELAAPQGTDSYRNGLKVNGWVHGAAFGSTPHACMDMEGPAGDQREGIAAELPPDQEDRILSRASLNDLQGADDVADGHSRDSPMSENASMLSHMCGDRELAMKHLELELMRAKAELEKWKFMSLDRKTRWQPTETTAGTGPRW